MTQYELLKGELILGMQSRVAPLPEEDVEEEACFCEGLVAHYDPKFVIALLKI